MTTAVMTIVGFHFVMAGADVLLLLGIARRGVIVAALAATLGLTAVALLVATLMQPEFFLGTRLLAYAVFLHAPLVLLATAGLRSAGSGRAVMVFLAAAIWAVALSAFLVEPYYLEETYITVRTRKVAQPVRIAILADLQTDSVDEYERLVLKRCMECQPDLILMAGDYLQIENPRQWSRQRERLRTWLEEIQFAAPLGVFAVRGNSDGPGWTTLFDDLPIRTMNGTEAAAAGELQVTGLDFMASFQPRLQIPAGQGFHIVLGHAPDFVRGRIDADLLVAGHTHGGQVRLPLLGPLITASSIPRGWAAGVTKLPGGRTLIVSRGVGMERLSAPRLRFLCRPELVMVDVVPAE